MRFGWSIYDTQPGKTKEFFVVGPWWVPFLERYTLYQHGERYLTRWTFLRAFKRAFAIHRIERPDGHDPHDHPKTFTALILYGGYREELFRIVPDGQGGTTLAMYNAVTRKPGRVNKITLKTIHRVWHLPKGVSWQLMMIGPKKQHWGFYRGDGTWVHHSDYDV